MLKRINVNPKEKSDGNNKLNGRNLVKRFLALNGPEFLDFARKSDNFKPIRRIMMAVLTSKEIASRMAEDYDPEYEFIMTVVSAKKSFTVKARMNKPMPMTNLQLARKLINKVFERIYIISRK